MEHLHQYLIPDLAITDFVPGWHRLAVIIKVMHTQRLHPQLDIVVNQAPHDDQQGAACDNPAGLRRLAHRFQQGRPKELALLATADEEDGEQVIAEQGKRIGP
ncbi:hypothetical protein NB694_003780 [Pantoea ananatis]|nr:hypothetical protein [Pantoea ananatis]